MVKANMVLGPLPACFQRETVSLCCTLTALDHVLSAIASRITLLPEQ